jgi:hypothetical protein
MRPICINHGCNEPVAYSRQNYDGSYRWRPHCSHCQAASYGKWPHRPKVNPFKKGKCSNQKGHLGFVCPTRFKLLPPNAKGITEIDHIDGDHTNNDPSNLQELCVICHKIKGQLAGDFDRTKKASKIKGYSGRHVKPSTFFSFFEYDA